MTLYRNKYRIESARLKTWDYASTGYYFFTICTKNRVNLFGEIINKQMILNNAGKIVLACWNDLPDHYPNLILDEFVIMPNHIHGIIHINNNGCVGNNARIIGDEHVTGIPDIHGVSGNTGKTNKTNHGLSEFIRALKSFSSRRINEIINKKGIPIWQSRFHDQIIRNDIELNIIRKYIKNNPKNHKEETKRQV